MNCVITGAADGIGRALAHRFAEAGYDIVGVDVDVERAERTQAELEALGALSRFVMADLGTEGGVTHLLECLSDEPVAACPLGIDVLIHNAGINAVGAFGQVELARQEAVIKVNLLAPMLITTGLLQANKFKENSTLVFISSLSHFVSYPGAASYAASKDGLASYARSLSGALSGSKINVLTVYPGPTKTAHARRYSPDNSREGRRMPPEVLANQIFHAVQTRQRVLIPGLGNRFFAWLGWGFPRLTEWMMRKVIFTQRARCEKLAGRTNTQGARCV